MQTIDAIKPIHKRRPVAAVDVGPPPSPRAVRAIDGVIAAPRPHVAANAANNVVQLAKNAASPNAPAVPSRPPNLSPRNSARPSVAPAANTVQAGGSARIAGHSRSFVAQPTKGKRAFRQSRAWRWIKVGLAVLGVVVLAFLGAIPSIGQIALLIYGVVALVLKLDSRVTFGFALAALVLIPLSQLLKAGFLAESYAIFAYLLLFIGTICLAFELRRNRKVKLSTT